MKETPKCCPSCQGKAIFVSSAGFVCLNRDCNYRQSRPAAAGALGGLLAQPVNRRKSPESAGPSHHVAQGSPFGGSV